MDIVLLVVSLVFMFAPTVVLLAVMVMVIRAIVQGRASRWWLLAFVALFASWAVEKLAFDWMNEHPTLVLSQHPAPDGGDTMVMTGGNNYWLGDSWLTANTALKRVIYGDGCSADKLHWPYVVTLGDRDRPPLGVRAPNFVPPESYLLLATEDCVSSGVNNPFPPIDFQLWSVTNGTKTLLASYHHTQFPRITFPPVLSIMLWYGQMPEFDNQTILANFLQSAFTGTDRMGEVVKMWQ